MSKQVLAIAAHPDDEVLGMGGTIARHVKEGNRVGIVFISEGVTARYPSAELISQVKDEIREREKMAANAAQIMGAEIISFGNFPDNRLDQIPLIEINKFIESTTREFKPDIIYTHHGGDLNIDHRIVHQAVMTAFRPVLGQKVKKIYAWENSSSTEWASYALPSFLPQVFVDIAEFMDKKLTALNCYEKENRPFPHPRSEKALKAMAEYRGAASGLYAAEAFMLIREII